MLNQFRTRYPQGSLLSELIAIEHGQYIVKVLVQVEGITLATGLAASFNLEQAEDTARHRALVTLNLEATASAFSQNHFQDESHQQSGRAIQESYSASTSSVPQSIPEATTLSSVETPKIQSNLIESPQETEKPKELPTEVLAEIPQAVSSRVTESSSNGAKKGQMKSKATLETRSDTLDVEPVVPDANLLTPSSTAEPPIESLDPLDSLDPLASSSSSPVAKTPKMPKTPKDKPVDPNPMNSESTQSEVLPLVESTPEIEIPQSELAESTPLIPTQLDEVTPPLPLPVEPSYSPGDTLDFSEIMAKSNAELKRLGWTTEKGRDYLLKTYGKKSRHLLNDQELLEFLNYLESLPTP